MRGWVVLGLALACAIPAAAQTSDVTDLQEDARLRFELGLRAYNRGEFAEAAEEFEEAYRLSDRPPLLYNAYLAYRDGRETQQAADTLRRYLAAAGDIPNRARLEETLRELDADLRGDPAPEPPSGEQQRPSGGGSVSIGPIVLISIGAAVGIASIITGALALARNDELTAGCSMNDCPVSLRPVWSELEALSIATDVLWPISVAALAAGVVWLAIDLSSSSSARALGLTCGPAGCSARLTGTFE